MNRKKRCSETEEVQGYGAGLWEKGKAPGEGRKDGRGRVGKARLKEK
jgi:hypothetical protein